MSEVAQAPQLRFPEFSGEWKEKKLDSVVSKFIVPMRDKPTDLTGSIPWCRIEDFDGMYLNQSKTGQGVSEETVKEMNLKVYPINTLLVSCSANLGFCAIVKKELITNQTFIGLQSNDNLINIEFLYYLMKLSSRRLNILSSGTTISYLSRREFENFKITTPSLPEQQKIAAFLTAVDNKIEQLSKKQALLGEYKKGLMQQIFSQAIRFKADDGSDFPDWKENKVDEFMEVTRGQVLAVPEMRQVESEIFKYPVYSSQTKNNGLTGYYTDYLFEDCITWTTDGANAGDVNYRAGKFYCTNVCGVLRSKKGYANLCIAQILNSVSRRYVSYVGNPKLMNNVMEKIKISIPSSINEQTKIANFLSSVDSKIEEVGKQLDESKQFKKALLQKMFV